MTMTKQQHMGAWILAVIVGALVIGVLAANRPINRAGGPNHGGTGGDVGSFYDGARIRWIVPYRPGGGYDEYARLIAPYFEKYARARVEVLNLPGAGGMRGAQELFAVPPDGLTVGMINGGAFVMSQLAGVADYDVKDLEFLARIVADVRVLVLQQPSPHSSFEDLRNSTEPVRLGATGLGGTTYVDAVVVKEAFGLDHVRVIHGFDSSSIVAQAMLRGDIDGRWGSWGSAEDAVDSEREIVVLQSGTKRAEDIADVPTALELASTTEDPERTEALLTAWESLVAVGRFMAAPPGTPDGKLEYLRAALEKALHDPELLQRMERAGRPVNYASGEETEQIINKAIALPADVEPVFIRAIKGGL